MILVILIFCEKDINDFYTQDDDFFNCPLL